MRLAVIVALKNWSRHRCLDGGDGVVTVASKGRCSVAESATSWGHNENTPPNALQLSGTVRCPNTVCGGDGITKLPSLVDDDVVLMVMEKWQFTRVGLDLAMTSRPCVMGRTTVLVTLGACLGDVVVLRGTRSSQCQDLHLFRKLAARRGTSRSPHSTPFSQRNDNMVRNHYDDAACTANHGDAAAPRQSRCRGHAHDPDQNEDASNDGSGGRDRDDDDDDDAPPHATPSPTTPIRPGW
ncbi:hypothetical protein EDB85DRAFT_2279000 [Lactarius pseudohatsudake]|nr:hypothetical protein EDB85DRAFT_2279000 [Lactarius pseudohatsudake]